MLAQVWSRASCDGHQHPSVDRNVGCSHSCTRSSRSASGHRHKWKLHQSSHAWWEQALLLISSQRAARWLRMQSLSISPIRLRQANRSSHQCPLRWLRDSRWDKEGWRASRWNHIDSALGQNYLHLTQGGSQASYVWGFGAWSREQQWDKELSISIGSWIATWSQFQTGWSQGVSHGVQVSAGRRWCHLLSWHELHPRVWILKVYTGIFFKYTYIHTYIHTYMNSSWICMICMQWIIAPPTGPVPSSTECRAPTVGIGPCGWGAKCNFKRVRTPSCSGCSSRSSAPTSSKPKNQVGTEWGATTARHQMYSQCRYVSHVKNPWTECSSSWWENVPWVDPTATLFLMFLTKFAWF